MKIVFGVDLAERSTQAIQLCGRLRFKQVEADLVHVIERIGLPGWEAIADSQTALIGRFLKQQEQEGRQALQRAESELKNLGIPSRTTLLSGFASNQLQNHATRQDAYIIAVASEPEGPLRKLTAGSIARKLVNNYSQSVLIAKRNHSGTAPVTAVLATDHSSYANECVDKLVEFAPQGIDKLVVVTAYPRDVLTGIRNVMDNLAVDIGKMMEEKLSELNHEVIEKLRPLGCKCESRVVDMPVNDAIRGTMESEAAELLILGAHGHGFVERFTLGSVSLHQAVAEPYSVFIIRR